MNSTYAYKIFYIWCACKIYQNNNSIRGVINCVNKLTLLDNSTDFNEKIFIFIPKNSLTLYLTK